MSEEQYRIIVVGDENVGKSSLIHLYTKGYYTKDYKSTIGVDLSFKDLCFDRKTNMRLFIWDITGQERFRFLTRIYYQNVSGCILVFDVNNEASFYNCEIWINNIYDNGEHLKNNIVLVGNKSDKEKIVKQEDIDYLCSKYNLEYKEISVEKNINVYETFNYILNKLVNDNTLKDREIENTVKILSNREVNKQKKKKCCKVS